jgi:hypothetical protein
MKNESNKNKNDGGDGSVYAQETSNEYNPRQDDEVSDAGTLESMSVMFAEAKHQNKNHPYDHTVDDDDAMTMTSMATILSAKQKQPKKETPTKEKFARMATTKAKSTSILTPAAPQQQQQQQQRPATKKAASTGGGTMFITMNTQELATSKSKEIIPSPPSEDDDDNLSNIIGRVDLQDNDEDDDDDVDVEGQDIINGTYGHPIVDEKGNDVGIMGQYSNNGNNKINDKRRMIAFCCSITALVVLIVVGIVFGLHKQQNNNGMSDVPAVTPPNPITPTGSPTIFGQTPSPTTTPYPTSSPTASPTTTPTSPPTINYIDPLMEFLEDNQVTFSGKDPKSPSFMAVQWLAEEANEIDTPLVYDDKLLQRYALLAFDFALERPADKRNSAVKVKALEDFNYFSQAFTIAEKHIDECEWSGIICGNFTGRVTEIHFGSSDLKGSIGSDIGLLQDLTFLDLANNMIQGTIPEELYRLNFLEEFYGYNNQLTGTLSSSIDNFFNLTRLHLSHNNLSGPLPETLKSSDVLNPIRK